MWQFTRGSRARPSVSNTPLQRVVESEPRRDTLAFQVDLWNARGDFPRSMLEVMPREKEIRYSSRTRAGTQPAPSGRSLRFYATSSIGSWPRDGDPPVARTDEHTYMGQHPF
jgi:NTE family protein